jgi:hypothetical protein
MPISTASTWVGGDREAVGVGDRHRVSGQRDSKRPVGAA